MLMLNRPTLFVGLIAAAFAVPYVATDKEFMQTASKQWNSLTQNFGSSKPAEPSLEQLIDELTAEHPPLKAWTPEPYADSARAAFNNGVRAWNVSSPSEGNASDSSSSGNSNSYGSTNSNGKSGSGSSSSGSGYSGGNNNSTSGTGNSNNSGYNANSSSGNSYNNSTTNNSKPAEAPAQRPTGFSAPPAVVDNLLEGPGIADLWEVFRFDAPPAWVLSRWKRVTTIVSERELRGLRVPLMTGTRPDDLAGSLTYYYDKNQVLQRITFDGHTGDDGRLVNLVCEQYGLRPVPSLQAGLYLGQSGRRIVSACRITHPPVVNSKEPLKRVEIALELNREGGSEKLSDGMTTILKNDRLAKKW